MAPENADANAVRRAGLILGTTARVGSRALVSTRSIDAARSRRARAVVASGLIGRDTGDAFARLQATKARVAIAITHTRGTTNAENTNVLDRAIRVEHAGLRAGFVRGAPRLDGEMPRFISEDRIASERRRQDAQRDDPSHPAVHQNAPLIETVPMPRPTCVLGPLEFPPVNQSTAAPPSPASPTINPTVATLPSRVASLLRSTPV